MIASVFLGQSAIKGRPWRSSMPPNCQSSGNADRKMPWWPIARIGTYNFIELSSMNNQALYICDFFIIWIQLNNLTVWDCELIHSMSVSYRTSSSVCLFSNLRFYLPQSQLFSKQLVTTLPILSLGELWMLECGLIVKNSFKNDCLVVLGWAII